MRLFQPRALPTESGQHKGPELDSKLKLLKQTSQLVKEKGQRVATPDKVAILELASNFEKRKLGKQQQILTDITRRCREQEVNDLSARLTSKCDLAPTPRGTSDGAFYMSKHFSSDGLSDLYADSILYAGTTVSEISPQDKSYKFFPARTKLRHQRLRTSDDLTDLHTSDSTKSSSVQTHLTQHQSSDKIMLPDDTLLSKASYGLHRRRRHLKNTKGAVKSTSASPTLLPGLNYVHLGMSDRGTHVTAVQKPISYSSDNVAISHGIASESEISSRKFEQPMAKSFIPRHVPSMPRVPSIESIGRAFAQSYNV